MPSVLPGWYFLSLLLYSVVVVVVIVVVCVATRKIPLKFGQKRVSNS